GIFSLARGNIAGVAMAGAGFDWKNIMLNFIATLGVGSIIGTFTGLAIAPLLPLVGLGIGMLQADQARKELVKAAKKELVKYLPQVAREQQQPVFDAIKECFDIYEREVTERMNDDIRARQSELENLVKQKESYEVDRGAEIERLRQLESEIKTPVEEVNFAYERFLNAV
ncbi:MAG: dynamin, partial [Cyanobacteriota bacterium]|nr:dynamin [Cyanobacteriota bacterium]